MDHGSCNIIYFDPRAPSDRTINAQRDAKSSMASRVPEKDRIEQTEVEQNVKALLSHFKEVCLCKSSDSCIAKLHEHCNQQAVSHTLLLIYISEEFDSSRTSQPQSQPSPPRLIQATESIDTENLQGLAFLQYIQSDGLSKTITSALLLSSSEYALLWTPKCKRSYAEYFALGVADVLKTPISPDRASSLPAHVYRTNQAPFEGGVRQDQASKRRASWVGVDETKPYAYLRESMVSGLMDRICDPSYVEKPVSLSELKLPHDRKSAVARAVGAWSFSAHEFSDDELLYGAYLVLQHVLQMPGLEKWHLSDDELLTFLMACRRVYNSFVIYHNFRHACDVLQAAFCFLLQIGVVPAFSSTQHDLQLSGAEKAPLEVSSSAPNSGVANNAPQPDSAYASLLRPFEAMTLVISCIGHDVGHPGVNNLFLVTLNAPLAQLYNDRSVLESFHCAAFSQILRRYWPAAFSDVALRKLMINAILATDMSHHTYYVDNFEKMRHEFSAEGFSMGILDEKTIDNHRELLCCLLIKCADICNVARKYNVATEWADILTNEFANQAAMETELEMPSCLFGGPPVLNDLIKMGTSQIGFINFFAIPLFTGMSQAFPGMKFTVEELKSNKRTWEHVIEDEKQKAIKDTASTASKDRAQSPHARRGSAFAQSQMRADPMVFGSHSSSSVNQTRRQSASASSEMASNAARRASLGPTVIPLSKSRPTSRQESTGPLGPEELPQQVQGASGIASAMGYDGQEQDGLANPPAKAPRSSTTVGSASVQELISNPPEFVSKDPSSLSPSRSDLMGSQQSENRPSTASPSSARGRGKELGLGQSSGADSGQTSSRPRSRSGRKFSLRFWRKAKSTDNLSRDSQ